jgi:hypothetical protein
MSTFVSIAIPACCCMILFKLQTQVCMHATVHVDLWALDGYIEWVDVVNVVCGVNKVFVVT